MSEFLQEMFSRSAVIATGSGFIVIGATFWAFRVTFKKVLVIRQAYVTRLRADGEEEKAALAERETIELARRIRRGGRLLVCSGVAVLLAEFLFRR